MCAPAPLESMPLYLPRSIQEQLWERALRTPAEEVVGAIFRTGTALRVEPLRNRARDRADSFLVDPEEWIRVFLGGRALGSSLWAIYHSHPQGPAALSARDREDAYPVIQLVLDLRELRLHAFSPPLWTELALRPAVHPREGSGRASGTPPRPPL